MASLLSRLSILWAVLLAAVEVNAMQRHVHANNLVHATQLVGIRANIPDVQYVLDARARIKSERAFNEALGLLRMKPVSAESQLPMPFKVGPIVAIRPQGDDNMSAEAVEKEVVSYISSLKGEENSPKRKTADIMTNKFPMVVVKMSNEEKKVKEHKFTDKPGGVAMQVLKKVPANKQEMQQILLHGMRFQDVVPVVADLLEANLLGFDNDPDNGRPRPALGGLLLTFAEAKGKQGGSGLPVYQWTLIKVGTFGGLARTTIINESKGGGPGLLKQYGVDRRILVLPLNTRRQEFLKNFVERSLYNVLQPMMNLEGHAHFAFSSPRFLSNVRDFKGDEGPLPLYRQCARLVYAAQVYFNFNANFKATETRKDRVTEFILACSHVLDMDKTEEEEDERRKHVDFLQKNLKELMGQVSTFEEDLKVIIEGISKGGKESKQIDRERMRWTEGVPKTLEKLTQLLEGKVQPNPITIMKGCMSARVTDEQIKSFKENLQKMGGATNKILEDLLGKVNALAQASKGAEKPEWPLPRIIGIFDEATATTSNRSLQNMIKSVLIETPFKECLKNAYGQLGASNAAINKMWKRLINKKKLGHASIAGIDATSQEFLQMVIAILTAVRSMAG